MVMTIVLLVIGIMVAVGGVVFLVKEGSDKESRNIYLITTVIGIVLVIGTVIKLII